MSAEQPPLSPPTSGSRDEARGAPVRGPSGRPLRVLFAAGPGDVVGTFRHWREGRDDPAQMSVTWSGQFLDVCEELGLVAHVVGWHPRADREADGQFTVENVPKPRWAARGGWRYHLGEQWYAARILAQAVRFRADVVVVTGGLELLLLRLARALRMRLVVDFSCVLWPKYLPVHRTWRLIYRLDRSILRDHAFALLSMSCDITRQLSEAAGGRPRPVLEYWPLYRPERFEQLPVPAGPPFRIVFAGRVERYKGALVLVELARRFKRSGKAILIEVCGDGGALQDVRRRVAEEDLSSHLAVHGYCMFDVLRKTYARAHAVIVPTTKDFAEGFNMVVAEAVLAGRPVITSAVCPSVHYLGDAVVQVPVDDVDAYERAIERLAGDAAFYAQTCEAGEAIREKFFDPENGFGAALRVVLEAALANRSPAPRILPLTRATEAPGVGESRASPVQRYGD